MTAPDDAIPNAPALRRALLAWYRRCARPLPWRDAPDPYRVWLSEILLQQTRVETGLPYYERFLRALPTVGALARADEGAVLKLWEGLGYYSRARNLHRAARIIHHERGGAFPATAAEWRALPGVGPYTAGAIASIACGERAAVVDGNVKRVLARLARIRDPVDRADTTAALWRMAEALLPRTASLAGEWNQALMELGALVCVPRAPRCDGCPVEYHCRARAAGDASDLPARTPGKPVPHVEVAAGLCVRQGRILLAKRPADGMLGGLWEFPGGRLREADAGSPPAALRRVLREEFGLTADPGPEIGALRHAFSHFRMTLRLFDAGEVRGRARAIRSAEVRWARRSELDALAFPTADRNLIPAIDGYLDTP
jgi:A/G-specific adenine glycosylase